VARFAVDKWEVDTLLLDDGFQYLHLKHRLDMVLGDRQAPFGNEFLLPGARCVRGAQSAPRQLTFSLRKTPGA